MTVCDERYFHQSIPANNDIHIVTTTPYNSGKKAMVSVYSNLQQLAGCGSLGTCILTLQGLCHVGKQELKETNLPRPPVEDLQPR